MAIVVMKHFLFLTHLIVILMFTMAQSQDSNTFSLSSGTAPDANADPLYIRAKSANNAFNFRPTREYGQITLETNIANASFYLGTFFVSRTPFQDLLLPVGAFHYRLTYDKYNDIIDSFSIAPKDKKNIALVMTARKGTAIVLTRPSDVTVEIGNAKMGVTKDSGLILTNLNSGTYKVHLTKTGFQPLDATLKVVSGEKTGLNAILLPNFGRIQVVSPEDESYVYVNNTYFGRAPMTIPNLKAGRALVRVEARKFAPFSQTVVIRSDQTESITAVLKKDRSYKDIGPYGELKGSWGDKDGDGIRDDDDQCPLDPEDVDGFEDQDGCPDPDNDHDGIADINEQDNKYRSLSEDFDGFEDNDGIPDFDNDRDGIPDTADLCRNEPEDRDGFDDRDGCPDLDNDADNVPDDKDLAPNDPEDIDGYQDQDGAADLDNDNDGIRDYMDLCPQSAEVFNNFQDDDGCPDVKIREPRMGVIKYIPYDFTSDFPESVLTEIDSVYNAMMIYPAIQVEIKVHCDGKGQQKRKTLETEERAKILGRYLAYRGTVDPVRYTVTGVGGRDPIASNVSEKGRQKNTRVEIKRLR